MNGLLRAAGFSLMAFFASCGVGARVEQSHAAPVAFTAAQADIQGDRFDRSHAWERSSTRLTWLSAAKTPDAYPQPSHR